MKKTAFILLALLAPFHTAPARSDDASPATYRRVAGMGRYNPEKTESEGRADTFKLEARLGKIQVWKLHPWVGVDLLPENAFYIGAGLETDIDLSENWVLTLQEGIGHFAPGQLERAKYRFPQEGIQFRSQIELAYRLQDDTRIGVNIAHMSNAAIQMPNPGSTIVGVVFHLPVK